MNSGVLIMRKRVISLLKNMEDSLNGCKQITLISHFYLINFSLSRKLIKSYTEKVFGLAGMINNYETVIGQTIFRIYLSFLIGCISNLLVFFPYGVTMVMFFTHGAS